MDEKDLRVVNEGTTYLGVGRQLAGRGILETLDDGLEHVSVDGHPRNGEGLIQSCLNRCILR